MFLPVGGREEGYSGDETNRLSLLISLKQKCNHFIPRYCAVVVSGASLYSSQSRNRGTATKKRVILVLTKKESKTFISNRTDLQITKQHKRSHRFSMSFLVQLTLDAVGGLAATFAQVGVDHPVGLSLAS